MRRFEAEASGPPPDAFPASGAPDPIAAQAIAWAVHLRSGEATLRDRADFDTWRKADPRHEAAATHMEHALGRIRELPDSSAGRQAMRRSLLPSANRRRGLRNTLSLLLAGGALGLLWAERQRPLSALVADFTTGTGERRVIALPDGSRLWLNARSVVDMDFDGGMRRLHLRSGELIVDVAQDAARAFVVHTAQGRVHALGTRFMVSQHEGSTLVAVLHSSVRIEPLHGAAINIKQGQSARFTAQGATLDAMTPRAASAWTDGFVEVHDRSLEEVVDALRPYRTGLLRVSPQAARLRITGSFPLDDSDRTLAALEQALPITVQRRTDWWVSIDIK
ncbi:FecR family protein [Pigmentiphaga aceris]|uniref:FecR family protein n=1 Tax=Pigmentiphaga aceris TaxID=1940612 RepID=A0A5C0AWD3_9BURK|nr:FecR family protein [Pigmentiphaga aceris]QEI06618.1 FecR family protein [Pigmentiphaga aceris]